MEHLQQLEQALRQQLPALKILCREPLAPYTSFRIGGPGAMVVLPESEAELRSILLLAQQFGVSPVLLGAGTNVLIPDAGLDALILRTKDCLKDIRLLENGHIVAQCGVTLARLAQFAQAHGRTGLEFAHGIPGTVGGGILMNAGAYGGEMAQVTVQTTVMELDGSLRAYIGPQQGFGYRHSAFMQQSGIILQAEFAIEPGDPLAIQAKMAELSQRRRSSQPLEYPSAGSTFKRPSQGYAAAMIEAAGLKGLRVGDAEVSTKHAGFVINSGHASCQDVLALMELVQQRVLAHSGILLEPEIRIFKGDHPCNS